VLKYFYEKNLGKHFNDSNRKELEILLNRNCTQKEIARVLIKAESAISYELKTFTRKNRKYNAEYAILRAYQKRRRAKTIGKKIVSDKELRKTVETYLLDDQSPEMISDRIKKHHKNLPSISGKIIRQFIASPYGRRIEAHRDKLKKKYAHRKPRPSSMEGKRMINKRPKYINTRSRIGDCEGDFIVSGKSGSGMILNVTDRKSRAPFLEKIFPVSIKIMENGMRRIKKRFPEMETLTLDNDLLFIHHKKLEKILNIKIYFCHKHSPWEKGSNENRNKLMRKYIPKRSDISKISKRFIQKLEEKLQRRIMKCLNHLTPNEVLTIHRKKKKR
jgi:IS30 family transposase